MNCLHTIHWLLIALATLSTPPIVFGWGNWEPAAQPRAKERKNSPKSRWRGNWRAKVDDGGEGKGVVLFFCALDWRSERERGEMSEARDSLCSHLSNIRLQVLLATNHLSQ